MTVTKILIRKISSSNAICNFRLFLVICSFAFFADKATASEHHVDGECLIKKGFSEIELRAARELCDGKPIIIEKDETLSSRFLIYAITNDPLASKIKNRGLSISGGKITGSLNLSKLKVESPDLEFRSEFLEPVDLRGTQFSGNVSFQGSSLKGGVLASRAVIAGSMMLGDTDDTRYDADKASGGSEVLFLRAPHLRVSGDIVIAASSITEEIDISNSQISGSIALIRISTLRLDLSASDISNQLIIFGCKINTNRRKDAKYSDVNLHSLRIKQSVYFNRTLIENDIYMDGADIAGDFIVLGSKMTIINARAARITGSLVLGIHDDPPIMWTKWNNESLLDLTNSKMGGIRGPEDLSVWPKSIDFYNASIGSFIPDFCGSATCNHSTEWYRQWLGLQPENTRSFAPFKNFVDSLILQGQLNEAQNLAEYGYDIEKDNARKRGEYFRYVLLIIYKFTIGYGYKLYYIIFWVAIFVLLGAIVFRTSSEAKLHKMPYGLFYSFDLLLPIVKLRELHYEITLHGFRRYYFYCHRLLGWTMGLLLGAAIGVLSK